MTKYPIVKRYYQKDYGCFGNTVKSGLGSVMILRNTIFFMMSLITVFLVRPDKKQINNQ